MVELVKQLNFFVALILGIAYAYQLIFVLIGLWQRKRHREPEAARLHKFAVVVCARNEQVVIGELIESLNRQ